MKETFIINGMHCTACARTVEKAVGKLDDVKSARVNFANRKLSVDYTVPAAAGIAKTVQPAGAMAGMGSETEVSSQKTDDSLLKNQLSAASASATSATSTAARSATVIQPAGSMAGMAGMAGMSGMGAGNISASATPTAFEQLVINTVKKAGYIAELPTSEEAQIQTQAQEIRVWGIKTIIGGVLSLPMLYFMFAEVFHWEFLMSVMPIVSLVIATVVQIGLGSTFYQGTWAGLRTFSFNMDSLVAIGTTTAYVFSVVLMFSGFQEMYFETSVLLITFVTFGKWLEARATGKTSSAIRELINLQPKIATLESGETVEVADLRIGDRLLVKPGEQIPADGKIVAGTSAIDESMVTGESIPVDKVIGDSVIGATINQSGALTVVVEKVGDDTMLSQIVRLVEQATSTKAPIEKLADKISSIFVPTVLVIAVLTCVVWTLIIGAPINVGLYCAVAVVVIACPCALGLATPTAVMVGTGKGSRWGVLIKGGDVLQKLAKVQAVVFDKTGTLTEGKPQVSQTVVLTSEPAAAIEPAKVSRVDARLEEDGLSAFRPLIKGADMASDGGAESATKSVTLVSAEASSVLSIAAALEANSEHSLAQAILSAARSQNLSVPAAEDFQALPGLGVQATVKGVTYYLGNAKFAKKLGVSIPNETLAPMLERGETVAVLFTERVALGIIGITDQPRETAVSSIDELKDLGVTSYILSGDNQAAVQAVADQLGIDQIFAEVLPSQKAHIIQQLRTNKTVAMVGDGINDAPALAQADVGIAMGSGTDIAIETGDVVLVKADPRDVAVSIRLARQVMRKIYQNLTFSLGYNILGIPIAAGVLGGFGIFLSPAIAGLAMALSSVSVVTNSLLLARR